MSGEEASIDTRASKSGINADQQKKADAKYEDAKHDLERAKFWMETVTGEPIEGDFFEFLRDGAYLCRFLNKIRSGLVPAKYEQPVSGRFKQIETIGKFLDGCKEYGMKQDDLFTTLDLYEQTDKNMVLASIFSLGRTAQKNGFDGPKFGPKESEQNERSFDPEKVAEEKKVIPLQSGSNKGASSAGMSAYGQQRQVYDPNI